MLNLRFVIAKRVNCGGNNCSSVYDSPTTNFDIYGKSCTNDSECLISISNSWCIKNMCKCVTNFRYNFDDKRCHHFYCVSDDDCQEDDYDRSCDSRRHLCVCGNSYEEEANSHLCIEDDITISKVSKRRSLSTSDVWHILVISLIVLVLVMLFKNNLYRALIKRRRRRRPLTDAFLPVASNDTQVSPPISVVDTHFAQVYAVNHSYQD